MLSSFQIARKNMGTTSTQGRQSGIQALRAFACAMVVLQHVTYFACDAKSLNYNDYLPIDLGQIGVGIFFVISGYVMGLCMSQGKAFLWNRVARIYPPYLCAIALSALLFMRPGSGWVFDLKSALLLPTSDLNTTYRIPYWTLCYEMAFYVVTYALVLGKFSKRGVQSFCLTWFLCIVLFNIYHHKADTSAIQDWLFVSQPGKWILLSPYSTFFVFGLFVSVSDVRKFEIPGPHAFAGAAILFWILASSTKFTFQGAYYIATAAAYTLALMATIQTSFGKVVSRIGDYSYGCYLIHIATIVAVETQLKPYADQIGLVATWTILLVCATAAGCVYGWLEHMVHARFTGQLLRRILEYGSKRTASMN